MSYDQWKLQGPDDSMTAEEEAALERDIEEQMDEMLMRDAEQALADSRDCEPLGCLQIPVCPEGECAKEETMAEKKREVLYDEQCAVLARHFLQDSQHVEQDVADLAGEIQEAVENYMSRFEEAKR